MNSKILDAAIKIIFPVQVFLSFFLLLRGHNQPGGGFIGGLALSMAFILKMLSSKRPKFKGRPKFLIATGLLFAVSSGTISLFINKSFLTGIWPPINIWGFVPSTVFFFDLGVFLLVTGITMEIITHIERRP